MHFRTSLLLAALSVPLALLSAHAQRVEVVGLAASFNVSQSWVSGPDVRLGNYLLHSNSQTVRFDDTGNRYSAFARVRLGEGAWFAQPELAYTSVLSSRYQLDQAPTATDPSAGTSYFGYRIRRAEVAALVGRHLGPRFYVLAGPVLARQRRQTASGAVYESLYGAVERTQLLAQAGLGLQVWRLDFCLRYEQGLTPYTRQLTYGGNAQDFRQHTNQFMLSVGALLYDRNQRWRHAR